MRPTTSAEREVLANNPAGDMPGQMTVETEPGDVAFYYSNLLHRGYNPAGESRRGARVQIEGTDGPPVRVQRQRQA